MDKKQYLELCEACDHLLLTPNVKIERVAIPWLHVIRAHPMFLKNYEDLFQNKIISKNQLLVELRIILNTSLRLLRLLLKKSIWWTKSHQNENKIDILFVSHLVSDSHSGKETDFYFGDLALKLLDNGVTSSFALINHTKKPVENFAGKWKESKIPRYILSDAIGFLQEVKFYYRSFHESRSLNRYSKTLGSELIKKVASRAAYEARLGGAIPSMRIGKQVNKLIRKLRPRFVITTYEGHGWERIIFAEAREAYPDICCLGYQHAAIFHLQHAIKRNLDEKFNPDEILSAGLVGYNLLAKSVSLYGTGLSVLGSYRGIHNKKVSIRKKKHSTCLVIPEGSMDECVLLFQFSLACAEACPEVEFIWRLHPLITFKEIQRKIKDLKDIPKNITLSDSLIENDIKASKFALYRGTTAIVQAINGGLIPLYYHKGDMIIDPIYEVNTNTFYINYVEDFLNLILENNFENLHFEKLAQIRAYSKEFFTPIDLPVFLHKIKTKLINHAKL